MSSDGFLDDLEAELADPGRAADRELWAEEERLRIARLGLRERIVAMAGTDDDGDGVRLDLRDGSSLVLAVELSGRDWVSGSAATADGGRPSPCLVPLHAVGAVVPSRPQLASSLAAAAPGGVGERIGIGAVLRDLCRRRAPVTVSCDGYRAHGTIDRVGRDHLDLAMHEPGVARRDGEVRQVRVIPFATVMLVRW
ncbi:hypothetical protein ARHIZOSPH14_02930 [Agromyces rhizosphaerae]|uniref:Uncharacterized protein n=1 Tax=Agromyces rhizosphaerae TaxID=88374 RepID=A0A9W6CNW2_9MICO|nr:hypothetical protein [Agromyces rhizosphaerae]GLI26051.1 hypothetical protein ARHIZOSPH14_02930 [Agromyces rhizosphaerae]